jgi:hypothetical protein
MVSRYVSAPCCPLKDQENEISERESQTMVSEGALSTASAHGSESPVTTDDEIEEEGNDPWLPMVEEVMQRYKTTFEEMKTNLIHNGLDEQQA